jgi:hypothetical protein
MILLLLGKFDFYSPRSGLAAARTVKIVMDLCDKSLDALMKKLQSNPIAPF